MKTLIECFCELPADPTGPDQKWICPRCNTKHVSFNVKESLERVNHEYPYYPAHLVRRINPNLWGWHREK